MKRIILYLILLNNLIVCGQYYDSNWYIYPDGFKNLNGKVSYIDKGEGSKTLNSSRWKWRYIFNSSLKVFEINTFDNKKIVETKKIKLDSVGNCVMSYISKDTFKTKYEYDNSSRIKKVISFYSRPDTLLIADNMQYDSLNNLVEFHEKILSPGGSMFRIEKIKYDSLNRIIQISDYDNDTMIYKSMSNHSQIVRRVLKFEYDNLGNLIKHERIENDIIKRNEQYSYKFDNKNNWIKSYIVGIDNKKYLMEERKIKYR